MLYADYEFYITVYAGQKIPAETFFYYASRASDYIDSLNISSGASEEKLAKACCAAAEVYYAEDDSSQHISSEKVGDYSVSYSASSSQTAVLSNKLKDAVMMYFKSVGWC